MITSTGKPVTHAKLLTELLQAVQLPKQEQEQWKRKGAKLNNGVHMWPENKPILPKNLYKWAARLSHGKTLVSTGGMVGLVNQIYTTYGFNSYSKNFCRACLVCAIHNAQGNLRPKFVLSMFFMFVRFMFVCVCFSFVSVFCLYVWVVCYVCSEGRSSFLDLYFVFKVVNKFGSYIVETKGQTPAVWLKHDPLSCSCKRGGLQELWIFSSIAAGCLYVAKLTVME